MKITNLSTMILVMANVCLTPLYAKAVAISSPSEVITVNADVVDGVPTYSVDYKGKAVIKPSTLGLQLADGPDMTDGSWYCISSNRSTIARWTSVSASMTTVSASATSSHKTAY